MCGGKGLNGDNNDNIASAYEDFIMSKIAVNIPTINNGIVRKNETYRRFVNVYEYKYQFKKPIIKFTTTEMIIIYNQ